MNTFFVPVVVPVFLGLGMFFLGWFAHAWLARPSVGPEDVRVRWRCPKCSKITDLPPDLGTKVLVCNNCQVRLIREGA